MGNRKHDIERYLRGEMTPLEKHNLEKEALRDPFLSDALEGAEHSGVENFLFDLSELKSTVSRRAGKHQPRVISMWKWSLAIAAGLMAIAVSGVYVITNNAAKQQQSEMMTFADFSNSQDTLVIVAPRVYSYNLESNKPSALNRRSRADVSGRIARVAQEETIVHEVERIVEVELTDVPTEIQRNPMSERESEIAKASPIARKDSSARIIIAGRVTSAEGGDGLPGVNVLVKGTSIGTVTDAEGKYQLAVVDLKQPTIVFSFIGYKEKELGVGVKSELNTALETDLTQLSEVVVTGAGATATSKDVKTFKFAEPQGGRDAFEKYLEQKLHYPETALDNKIEGKVTIQFTVSQSGDLLDFQILKGLGYGCDEEVIRLIKEGPSWTPTQRNDEPVTDKVKVRLKFQLPE